MSRRADHPIHPSFLRRHSPRAMSGAPLPIPELLRLFEAARWAPSSGNGQPWRFVLAPRTSPGFAPLLDVLDEGNRAWCSRASALVVVCAETKRTTSTGERVTRRLAAFDAGAAWMSIALQGSEMGLVVHAMEGFDSARAHAVVHASDDVDVLAIVAVGLPGDQSLLSEKSRVLETPNSREPIESRVFLDRFSPR
jgi:nitroreductase